jgi:hypothetical protein
VTPLCRHSSGETTLSALSSGAFFVARLDESLLWVLEIGRLVSADDLSADEAGLDLGLAAAFKAESSKGLDAMGFTASRSCSGWRVLEIRVCSQRDSERRARIVICVWFSYDLEIRWKRDCVVQRDTEKALRLDDPSSLRLFDLHPSFFFFERLSHRVTRVVFG